MKKEEKEPEKKEVKKPASALAGSVAKSLGSKGPGKGRNEVAEGGSKQAAPPPARPKPKPVEGQTFKKFMVILYFFDLYCLVGPKVKKTNLFLDVVPVRTMAASMGVGPTGRGQCQHAVASTSSGLAEANSTSPWRYDQG